jgi:hypothetical protein
MAMRKRLIIGGPVTKLDGAQMRYDAWRTCNCAAHYCTVRTVLSTFANLQRQRVTN